MHYKLNKCWSGVKQSTRYPTECVQFDSIVKGDLVGREDCLFLNVFTSDVNSRDKKPVIVYIHGGGFLSGASKIYQPFFFMENKIVLVTINYRLGPMGFSSTEDNVIEANIGLKDQLLALKWVNENIVKFGGDNSKVTLMGESAGAASAHYHMFSKSSSGLFSKIIALSGSVFSPWAFSETNHQNLQHYAKQLGCSSKNSKEIKSCLKTLSAESIVELQRPLLNPLNGFLHFTPTTEKNHLKCFLCHHPEEIWNNGKIINHVPIMFGVNSNEGSLIGAKLFTIPSLVNEIKTDWKRHAHTLLLMDPEVVNASTIEKIRMEYFGEKFSENFQDFLQNFNDLMSDRYFNFPIRQSAEFHANHGQRTYIYFYNYTSSSQPSTFEVFKKVGKWPISKYIALAYQFTRNWFWKKDDITGSAHGDDLLQVFNMDGVSAFMAARDADFSRKFINALVDFATNENNLTVDGVLWHPMTNRLNGKRNRPLKYFYFGNKKSEIINEPFSQRAKFWQQMKFW